MFRLHIALLLCDAAPLQLLLGALLCRHLSSCSSRLAGLFVAVVRAVAVSGAIAVVAAIHTAGFAAVVLLAAVLAADPFLRNGN